MILEADLHTHTIASGHGYGTVREMAQAAAAQGLKMLAVTDHGLAMPGGPDYLYFYNLYVWPRWMEGVEVLRGVEANILDQSGRLDMPDEILDNLDLVLAGFHSGTGYQGQSVEENTRAMVAALRNPFVHIIVHPGNPHYPIDVETVVLAAKGYGKALELNSNSFTVRPGSLSRCDLIARLAKRHQVLVSINSDAHTSYAVGDFTSALALAQKNEIDPELVLNTSAKKIHGFLDTCKRHRTAATVGHYLFP